MQLKALPPPVISEKPPPAPMQHPAEISRRYSERLAKKPAQVSSQSKVEEQKEKDQQPDLQRKKSNSWQQRPYKAPSAFVMFCRDQRAKCGELAESDLRKQWAELSDSEAELYIARHDQVWRIKCS